MLSNALQSAGFDVYVKWTGSNSEAEHITAQRIGPTHHDHCIPQ